MLQPLQLLVWSLMIQCAVSFVWNNALPRRCASSTLPSLTARSHCGASSRLCSSAAPTSQDPAAKLCLELKGTGIYLVGMMGSGKSTLGDALAKKLGYRFLDTDEIAEFMVEMPIADFFKAGNEKEFRELEYQILMQMAQYTRVVTATGGGIVMKRENWGLLRHGIVVYLDVSPEDVLRRLQADESQISKRPLLAETDPLQKLQSLQEERAEMYAMADVKFEVPLEKDPAEAADVLITTILQFITDNPPLWKSWKKERDKKAVDMAAAANPAAVNSDDAIRSAGAAAMEGSEEIPKGSIQYVSLSDIQSGKVKLPGQPDSR